MISTFLISSSLKIMYRFLGGGFSTKTTGLNSSLHKPLLARKCSVEMPEWQRGMEGRLDFQCTHSPEYQAKRLPYKLCVLGHHLTSLNVFSLPLSEIIIYALIVFIIIKIF